MPRTKSKRYPALVALLIDGGMAPAKASAVGTAIARLRMPGADEDSVASTIFVLINARERLAYNRGCEETTVWLNLPHEAREYAQCPEHPEIG